MDAGSKGGEDRHARLAAALRANLRRRRAQAQGRAARQDAPTPDADPAVKPPQTPPKGR
jgi:hypothetical protein